MLQKKYVRQQIHEREVLLLSIVLFRGPCLTSPQERQTSLILFINGKTETSITTVKKTEARPPIAQSSSLLLTMPYNIKFM